MKTARHPAPREPLRSILIPISHRRPALPSSTTPGNVLGLAPVSLLHSTGRGLKIALMIGLALLVALLSPPARAQGDLPVPQSRLPIVELTAGMHLIRAELAEEPGTRARGLMMREKLGNNEGMLFVFPEKAGHCFWMRNTLIALSIAFLDDDGTIVNIADMNPRSEQSHCPARPIRFALEMERGWFATRGLAAGMKLSAPRVFRIQPRQ